MRDKKLPDHYAVLHVTLTAGEAEIRRQYRILSKQFHPDMGGSHDDMAKINEAYSVLSDQFRRSMYDAELRRALHVPLRTAQQPTYTSRQQPAPRAKAPFAAKSIQKQRTSWWTVSAWFFALLILVVGILAQLPLAESHDTHTQTTASQPLAVTYPPESNNAGATTTPTLYTAPDGTSYGEPAETPNSQPRTNKTCSNNDCYSSGTTCSDDTCAKQPTQPKKNCVTKTFGLYQHTVCNAPGGSNSCTNDMVGSYRYTTCD